MGAADLDSDPVRPGSLALVTGGTGFVGSHVVDELLEAGYRVRCAVRGSSDLRWLTGKSIELVEADLASDDLSALVAGVDVTFHVAGLTRGSSATLERANVTTTERLVAALQRARGAGRVVYCSSTAAAGAGTLGRPRHPDDPLEPSSDYGYSKRAAEQLLEAASGLRVSILRPVAVYGPRDRDTLPFFRMAAKGFAITPGLRRRKLQLVHGRDVATAMRLAAETSGSVGRALFIGHPDTPEWPEVLEAISEAVGRRVLRIPMPSPAILAAGFFAGLVAGGEPGQLDFRRARDMVARAWTADVSQTRRILQWTPVYDVRRGFKQTAEWYLDKGWL